MNHTAIYQRISELLQLLDTNNRRLSAAKLSPVPIDVDLLRKYTLELYGLINQLEVLPASKVESSAQVVPKTEEVQEPESEAVMGEQPLAQKQKEEPPALVSEVPILETEEILPTPEETKVPEIDDTPEPVEQVVEPRNEKTGPKSVSKKLDIEEDENTFKRNAPEPKKQEEAQLKLSVHDKAGLESKTKIYEKFNQAGIVSIRKNISIMKRFELQKSLFKDNPDYYNDAIRFFDDAPGLSDAINEFNELGTHFGWDMKSDLVLELRDLITRRHM